VILRKSKIPEKRGHSKVDSGGGGGERRAAINSGPSEEIKKGPTKNEHTSLFTETATGNSWEKKRLTGREQNVLISAEEQRSNAALPAGENSKTGVKNALVAENGQPSESRMRKGTYDQEGEE